MSHRLPLTVAQLAIEQKSNEIPALQPMLETLPCLEGSVITADAMQCQQQAARYLTQQRGADYLFGLKGKVIKQEQEYSYYVTSLACAESTQGQIAQIIRGHWDAVENGSHYRRDVTLGEDASRISGRAGAHVMATLRNLVLGLFELQKHRGKTNGYVPGWQRQMSGSNALTLIKAKN